MKICRDCNQSLPYTAFSIKTSCKDGYNVRCKRCHTIRYKKGSLERIVKKIYNTQISNSIKRNHSPPEYSLPELIDWVYKQPNWDELYQAYKDSDYDRMSAPSIDRLDSLKPYTFDNIRLVSWRENQQQSADDKVYARDTRILKPVRALNPDGTLYKEYHSLNAAARAMKVSSLYGISSVANGVPVKDGKGYYYTPKTYKGYKWEWV